MQEGLSQLRGTGLALEMLRNRWTYPVLVALRDHPLRPAQLLDHINEGNRRNADLVGTRVLHEKTLYMTLRRMEGDGLIIRQKRAGSGNGATPRELPPMSRGLLAALHCIAAWAGGQRDQLATFLRVHRGWARAGSQLGDPKAVGPRHALSPDQEYWRDIGMALVILRLRWGFAVLSQLRHGGQHPTGIGAAVNAGIARNRDITGHRTMSDKVLWDTLHRLVEAGLVNYQPRQGQFASTARCDLTLAGRTLLAALAPLGVWAGEVEEHLALIVRRRRGLDSYGDEVERQG
ncbi:hypothetical protein AB0I98_35560 [Streptomyces sp. NPDC050211]|uniref:winged helix-turn-helix transcriptional regulator n=1 Tax=Streptomyces sp. NPDC050211 TaxID=3154932 RepID=UPI00342343C7